LKSITSLRATELEERIPEGLIKKKRGKKVKDRCQENRRAQYKLMRRLDWRLTETAMERTATPALVIWGREDRLWPVSMAARFSKEKIRESELHILQEPEIHL
jgi:pimeloyl-ACP methyl ester carboxylesterase